MFIEIPLLLMLFLGLTSIIILISYFTFKIGFKKGTVNQDNEWQGKTEEIKKNSLNKQRVVIKGKISEQLAPFFPNFPFKASECRFLGSPIDLVVFNGMDNGHVESIYLIDVKTNSSRLSSLQSSIVNAVNSKQVFWYTYNIELPDAPINNNFQNTSPINIEQDAEEMINNLFSEPNQVK